MPVAVATRYAPTRRWLHWGMALLIAAAYLLIEQRGLFARGSGGRSAMVQGHYWIGITVFVLAWWRLGSRWRHPAPPITPPLDGYSASAARLVHWALYAFCIAMPLLGVATAWSDGKTVALPFTDIALPPLLAVDKERAEALEDLHRAIGEAFYWVIGAHVLAALYHHRMRRDDTLRRML